jgi:hypothetical protein
MCNERAERVRLRSEEKGAKRVEKKGGSERRKREEKDKRREGGNGGTTVLLKKRGNHSPPQFFFRQRLLRRVESRSALDQNTSWVYLRLPLVKIYSNKEFSQLPKFLRNEQVVPDSFRKFVRKFWKT